MTMDALAREWHVLCEKPRASTPADAQMMWAKAEEIGVQRMIYFSWHAVPACR